MTDRPWHALNEVHDHFGYRTHKSALNAISKGTFPVETFVVGGIRAVHRDVYDAYFNLHREAGLKRLDQERKLDNATT
jgi:hypothetical protein